MPQKTNKKKALAKKTLPKFYYCQESDQFGTELCIHLLLNLKKKIQLNSFRRFSDKFLSLIVVLKTN